MHCVLCNREFCISREPLNQLLQQFAVAQFLTHFKLSEIILAQIIFFFLGSQVWIQVCLHGKQKLTTALIMIL